MLVNLFLKSLVLFGCGLLVTTPWIVIYEEIKSHEANGIAIIVSGLLCIFEVLFAVDFLIGVVR